MAQTITLFKDYAGGQGAGANNYVTYAEDIDTDHTAIEAAVNQLAAEVNANLAANALLSSDLLQINDPTATVEQQGVVGEHSYEVSINGGDASQLFVTAGSALVNARRVASDSTATLQGTDAALGTGATNAVSVYVDGNGLPNVVLTASLPALTLELASLNWNGVTDQFEAPITQEAPIFFDGDDYAQQLARAAKGAGPAFAAKSFRTSAARTDAIERMIAGVATDSEGDPIGTPEFTEVDLGDGTAADPSLGFQNDLDTGVFLEAVGQFGITVAGTRRVRVQTDQILVEPAGTNALPVHARVADPDTGLYFPAANQLALATGGLQALLLSAEQHIDSPTQPRFDWERDAVQSVATGAGLSVITLDVQNTNVGGWGTVGATATVPAGGDGFYLITAAAEFQANTSGTRRVAITRNGAGLLLSNRQGVTRAIAATGSVTTYLSTSALIQLSAGDVLRLEVSQTSGIALNVQGGIAAVKLW